MPQTLRVNVDAMSWEVPNPIVGQPPVPVTHFRGEIVEVPDYVLQQKKYGTPEVEKTLAHYPPAPGDNMPRARWEPVLVDPAGVDDEVASAAAQRAEIADLEERLAKLRQTTPPAPAPMAPSLQPNTVVLTPSVTGVRLIATQEAADADPVLAAAAAMPTADESLDDEVPFPPEEPPTPAPDPPAPAPDPSASTMPLPSTVATAAASTSPDLGTMDARDLTRLLSDQPDLADAVEAAEQRRAEPRVTVLQAVARARTAGT